MRASPCIPKRARPLFRRWVMLPGRPMIDRDGAVLRDDQGKTKYATILQFETREASDDFSRATIAAVLERFPAAFDDVEG
jgi:hypothetical protein